MAIEGFIYSLGRKCKKRIIFLLRHLKKIGKMFFLIVVVFNLKYLISVILLND